MYLHLLSKSKCDDAKEITIVTEKESGEKEKGTKCSRMPKNAFG